MMRKRLFLLAALIALYGGSAGAVLSGQSGAALTAFTSADGVHWRQIPAFGRATAEAVSGVAVTTAGPVTSVGAVIAVGGSQPGSQRLITAGRAAGGAAVATVSLAAIPGGVQPQVAVDAVAATGTQGGQQEAVGGANGFPAACIATRQPKTIAGPSVVPGPG